MTSRINKRQSQDVILYQVDQEPVWLDMAFPKSFAVFLLTRGHGIFPPTLYPDVKCRSLLPGEKGSSHASSSAYSFSYKPW